MIRKAEACDIKGISELLRQVLMVHHRLRPDLFIPNTQKYGEEELLKIITDDSTPVFVDIDLDGSVSGYAFCVIEDQPRSECCYAFKTLYVDDICVDENKRGRHIATDLYKYVREYAKSIGCRSITLNVWEGNAPARAFYEKMGMGIRKTMMEEIL